MKVCIDSYLMIVVYENMFKTIGQVFLFDSYDCVVGNLMIVSFEYITFASQLLDVGHLTIHLDQEGYFHHFQLIEVFFPSS